MGISFSPSRIGPVDGGTWQRDVKRHAVVARGERLEVSADLVADIALRRGAVGADDAEIDQPVLHEMPARVVDDDGMRHAMLVQFPRGERRALVARPRFIDPDVDPASRIMRHENRRERRAPIDAREPARIAMSENVELANPVRLSSPEFRGKFQGRDARSPR